VGRGTRARYVLPDGTPLRDSATLERIRLLAIPPAWTDVRISEDPRDRVQATGRDARGRKQYRYSREWRRRRDRDKFERMIRFAQSLPRMRSAVEADLRRRGWPRDKALALVVRVLDLTSLRVGGDEYVRLNRSYGLTTLRRRHVVVRGSAIRFRFRGKGDRVQVIDVRDRRLAGLLSRIQELPGSRLFMYLDAAGRTRPVRSQDVNAYLRTISGADITAKDFRTWAGTVEAFRALVTGTPDEALSDRQRLARAIEAAADRLGNTAAVTRTSYVDPALLEAWNAGDLSPRRRPDRARSRSAEAPTPAEEAAVLRLVAQRRRRAPSHRARSPRR
jgi:DNA topoisomerase-1